jgi:hypothetical protein
MGERKAILPGATRNLESTMTLSLTSWTASRRPRRAPDDLTVCPGTWDLDRTLEGYLSLNLTQVKSGMGCELRGTHEDMRALLDALTDILARYPEQKYPTG